MLGSPCREPTILAIGKNEVLSVSSNTTSPSALIDLMSWEMNVLAGRFQVNSRVPRVSTRLVPPVPSCVGKSSLDVPAAVTSYTFWLYQTN